MLAVFGGGVFIVHLISKKNSYIIIIRFKLKEFVFFSKKKILFFIFFLIIHFSQESNQKGSQNKAVGVVNFYLKYL